MCATALMCICPCPYVCTALCPCPYVCHSSICPAVHDHVCAITLSLPNSFNLFIYLCSSCVIVHVLIAIIPLFCVSHLWTACFPSVYCKFPICVLHVSHLCTVVSHLCTVCFAAGENFPVAAGGGNKRMSVERIYQKKTQLEHILLRPDTYIGSVETVTQVCFCSL